MTTQALVPNGLLDDLLVCEHCDEPMRVTQGNKSPAYQCTTAAGDPPKPCPTPTFDAKQLEHEILAELARGLITPDTLERLIAATRRISNSAANINDLDSDPERYAATIHQLAHDPETYTRTEVLQQTKDLLANIVERITISPHLQVIHFAIPLPDRKIGRKNEQSPTTPTPHLS